VSGGAQLGGAREDAPAPLLELRGVAKRFGATVALDGVSLALRGGEVHALIGENGAGKSTLMKVLAGIEAPDAGEMRFLGQRYAPRSPSAARALGVAMIHQELAIAPHLSVEANVLLGVERTRGGFLRRREQRRVARAALERLGRGSLDLATPAGALPIAEQQIVEIARALASSARVLVLDEPTSSLGAHDVERLFALVRELAREGLAVVYISHFLEEVAALGTRYTVLRDGRSVASGLLAETSAEQLVRHMVGREMSEMFPRVPHARGEALLHVRGLTGAARPREVSFTLHRGEILGLAGLVGAGRSEVLRCLYGLDPVLHGEVRSERGARVPTTPRASIAAGLGFVSEDRKGEGLFLDLSLADNLCATHSAPFARGGLLSLRRRDRAVRARLEELQCKARGPRQSIRELSGGNQQKIALARLLHQDAEILLLDEPTRGIDVGTKAEIYRLIGELAAQGKAVILVSSYLPELLNVCDTLGVLCRGRLVALRPIDRWTREEVMRLAVGA
jgi:ribose transport system ATP-binding protein